jgi:hypothetical protein
MLCLAKRDIAPWGAVIFLAEQGVYCAVGRSDIPCGARSLLPVASGIACGSCIARGRSDMPRNRGVFFCKKFQENFRDTRALCEKGRFFVQFA